MPPKLRFTRELIIQTSKAIIERDGVEHLNHRSVAAELGCSTQPILSNFKTMDELRCAVRRETDDELLAYIEQAARAHVYPMDGAVYAYIEYASTRPKLFLFLLLDSLNVDHGETLLGNMKPEPLLADLATSVKLDWDGIKEVYKHCWLFVHGIAVSQATGVTAFTHEEITRLLHVNIVGVRKALGEDIEL